MKVFWATVILFGGLLINYAITELEVQTSEELAVKQLHSNEVAAANRVYKNLGWLKIGVYWVSLTGCICIFRKEIGNLCKSI